MPAELMNAYRILFEGVLVVLGALLLFCLIRAVRGPQIADRVIAINMIGTLTVIVILVLAFLLGEGYLTDVSMIYTLLSFLAVVLLAKIYIGVWRAKKEGEKHD